MSLVCPSCSHNNPDDSRFCQKCGSPLSESDRSTRFEPEDRDRSGYGEYGSGAGGDYVARSSPSGMLVWSILATVFCCQPAGIVAIVFTALAMSADGQGNYAQADRNLSTAKTWAWAAFGIGLAGYLIYLVFVFIAVAAGP